MNKVHPFLLVLSLILIKANLAQHCQYDYKALIGVRPIDVNNNIINGLRITMIDNQANPIIVTKSIYKKDKYISSYNDTAEFWRNPAPNKDKEHITREEEKRHFIQADKDYIIITINKGNQEKGRVIKIEDIDGEANGGKFNTKIVMVSAEHIQNLCGYPDDKNFIKEYLPLFVTMEKPRDRSQFITTKKLNGYTFIYDKGPLGSCAECNGCYCESFFVTGPDSSILFNEVFHFKESIKDDSEIENGNDSFQIGDYNFDGVPDFRFFSGYKKYQTVYLYNNDAKKYKIEPLLSRMVGTYIDYQNKILMGVIIDSEPHVIPSKMINDGHSYDHHYQMSGKNLTDVRIISSKFYNLWTGDFPPKDSTGKSIDARDTGYYNYYKYKLEKKDNYSNLYHTSKTISNFKFDLDLSSSVYKNRITFNKHIKIKDVNTGKLLFENKLNNIKIRNTCTDSIEVADYNFDGCPDYRECSESFKYTYWVYDKDSATFIKEPMLNKMDETVFDFPGKKLKGSSLIAVQKKGGHGMNPMDHVGDIKYEYVMSGENLKFVRETIHHYKYVRLANDKINVITDTLYYSYQNYKLKKINKPIGESLFYLNQVIAKPFIFQLDKRFSSINSEGTTYEYTINVKSSKDNNEFYVNHFYHNVDFDTKDIDSLSIKDYNFDGYPDFSYLAIKKNENKAKFLGGPETHLGSIIYFYDSVKHSFEMNYLINSLEDVKFDFKNKTITGKKYEPIRITNSNYANGYSEYTFKGEGLKHVKLTFHPNIYEFSNTKPIVDSSYLKPKYFQMIDNRLFEVSTEDSNKIIVKKIIKKTIANLTFEKEFVRTNPSNLLDQTVKEKYRVIDNKTGKLILELNGVLCNQNNYCSDTLNVNDYNFDGYPDLLIANSKENENYQIYIYSSESNTFKLQTIISKLSNIEINLKEKKITGLMIEYENVKEMITFDNPSGLIEVLKSKTQYTLIGKNYKYIIEEKTYFNRGVKTKIDTNYYNYNNEKTTLISKSEFYKDPNNLPIKKNQYFSKSYKVHPFIFEYKKEKVNYRLKSIDYDNIYTLNVYYSKSNKQFFTKRFVVNNTFDTYTDSLYIGDYNFDGYPDFALYELKYYDQLRYQMGNGTTYMDLNYYTFDSAINIFKLHFISELYDVKYDYKNKIVTGKKYNAFKSDSNGYVHGHYVYELYGKGLNQVKRTAKLFDQSSNQKMNENEETYFNLVNNELKEIKKDNNTIKVNKEKNLSKTIGDFTFEKNKVPLNPKDSNSLNYREVYSVINNKTKKTLLKINGHICYYPCYYPNMLNDTLNINDYNFDGYPDLMYNGYYLNNPETDTFQLEKIFTKFENTEFNFENKTIIGTSNIVDLNGPQTGKFGQLNPPKTVGKTKYILIGKNYQYVMIEKTHYNKKGKDRIDTTYCKYINSQLINVSKSEFNNYLKQNKAYLGNNPLFENSKLNELSNSLRFKIEKKLTHIKLPSENGYYANKILVYNNKNNQLLFSKEVIGKKSDNEQFHSDSIEIADYNFDGVPDFRFLNSNQHFEYFVFDKEANTFLTDPLLNRFDKIKFNFMFKNFIGSQLAFFENKNSINGSNRTNENLDFETSTYVFGSGTQYVKEFYKKYLHTKDGLRSESKTNYYKYVKYQLIPISESDYNLIEKSKFNNDVSYLKPPFKFVLEKNTKGIELPAENGYYANKIFVYEIKNNTLIYSMVAVGNKLKEASGCFDSLQIADYNFDGFPDFRVCNNSNQGKHTYYIYDKKRHTFIIEKTLSELHGLLFDFELKTAQGNTERKEHFDYPWNTSYQYYYETLKFEGVALENLTISTTNYGGGTNVSEIAKYINQKRIYAGDTIAIKIQKNNILTKTVGPFKFEMEFNPEENKPDNDVKGAYVKVLNIYNKNRSIGGMNIVGNYYNEVPHWLDSLEIEDFNFDGFPDIRIFNSSSKYIKDQYIYYIYNSDKDVQSFYYDTYFSSMIGSEFYPNQKILKGKIINLNKTIYLMLKNDTLTLTEQDNDLSKSPFIQEFKYKNGVKTSLRAAYGNLEPENKKEYGDYNFDGHEDFRQQSKVSPFYWNVYLYNKSKETFEKDTLMSKFLVFNYNKLEKKLDGYYTLISSDFLARTTYYYQWSLTENKMILYQTQLCIYKSPSSESSRCTVSRLIDGKWIDTEVFGAE